MVDPKTASNAAVAQLTKSLQHELDIRGLKMKPGTTMTFNTTSLYIEKKYGIALAALGFVNYIFPEPMPVMPKKGKKIKKKRRIR